MSLIKYFNLEISESVALKGTYNLKLSRLIKKKEAIENGFAPMDQWKIIGDIKCVGERDAMCLKHMLEAPREPLQNHEEEKMWAEALADLSRKAKAKIAERIDVAKMEECRKPIWAAWTHEEQIAREAILAKIAGA